MDSTLFKNWIRETDNQFEKENPYNGGLKVINVFYFLPNTTSALQPMDQGVIPSLKERYRSKVVQKLIEAISRKKSLATISLLDAMKMLVLAWDEVTNKTMLNFFKKAGFSEIEDDGAVSADSFAALKDPIT